MRLMERLGSRLFIALAVAIVIALLRSTGALGATLELAYGESTTNVTITAATCCTYYEVVSTGAVAYDGSTPVQLEAFIPQADMSGGSPVRFALFEDGSILGDLLGAANSTSNTRVPMHLSRRFTPSSGTHTYSLRVATTSNSSDMRCATSAVQALAMRPCSIRVTRANPTVDTGGGASQLDDLTDVDTTGVANNDVLKWDTAESLWKPEADATSSGGSGGTVALSSDDRERLDLMWWGTWAIVGLIFALMLAPQWFKAFRVTHGR